MSAEHKPHWMLVQVLDDMQEFTNDLPRHRQGSYSGDLRSMRESVQRLLEQNEFHKGEVALLSEMIDGLKEQLEAERQKVEDLGSAAIREASRCNDFRRRREEAERELALERDRANGLLEQFEAAIKLLREIDEANPNGYYGEFSVRAFLGVNDGRD